MIITSDKQLRNFDFWSGATENVKELSYEQLDELEGILENLYPDGIDETQLNDLMWFEFDQIKEWLNISNIKDEKK